MKHIPFLYRAPARTRSRSNILSMMRRKSCLNQESRIKNLSLPILPPPSPSRPRVPKRTTMYLRCDLLAVQGSGKPLLAVAIPLPCWPGICNEVLPLQLQQHDTLSYLFVFEKTEKQYASRFHFIRRDVKLGRRLGCRAVLCCQKPGSGV